MQLKLLITLTCIGGLSFSDCLAKYKANFIKQDVWFVYDSKTPKSLYVNNSATKDKACKTTYSSLKQYLAKSYNYFTVDNAVIYDYLATINPVNNEKLAEHYLRYDRAKYEPISIVNNRYGCYRAHIEYNTSNASYPNDYREIACLANNTKLKLFEVANDKNIIKNFINSNYISNILKQAKISKNNINSFENIVTKLENYDNEEWQCIQSVLNKDFDSFAITKLNTDGTINLELGLTNSVHACSGIYKTINLTNIKPKFKITMFKELASSK